MKWLVMALLVASCVATPSSSTSEPDPEISKADAMVARLLGARRAPALALPDRPITHLARCTVEIGPRPAGIRDVILAAFAARNGPGWRISDLDFDGSSRVLRRVLEPTDGPRGPLMSHTEDEALELTLAFVVANYDLFGLSTGDLAHVTAIVGNERDDDSAIARQIEVRGDHGHAERGDGAASSWTIEVSLGRMGQIRAVSQRDVDPLPAVQQCSEPGLAPQDPRVLQFVLGHHLSHGDLEGDTVEDGEVTMADIEAPTLVTTRLENPEGTSTVLRLTYEMVVRHELPWSFVVDADTGELVAVNPLFVI